MKRSFYASSCSSTTSSKIQQILKQIENDKYVALTMLRNAENYMQKVIPFAKIPGTITIFAKKVNKFGQEEMMTSLSKGVYKTTTPKENLRYSQTIPLDMYKEINSGVICLLKLIL